MGAAGDEIDYEAAYAGYLHRFAEKFGERPAGSFVKFGRAMVQRLGPEEFPQRLEHYVRLHRACKNMLESGSTISDALVLDFVEASAWIAIEAPNMYAMFRGELGDPKRAAPDRKLPASEATDPEVRVAPPSESDSFVTLPLGRKAR